MLRSIFKLLSILTLFCCVYSCDEDHDNINSDGIRYSVTFNYKWNATDFPTSYPSNAHFSPLLGFSHVSTLDMFDLGSYATGGIKSMAETGSQDPLCDELNDLIAEDEAHYRVSGDGLGSGVGSITAEVLVTEEHSSITFVSMIAPSPDWYVGIVNVSLLEDGELVDEFVLEASVFDSGTDSGVSFTSENEVIDPVSVISLLDHGPLVTDSVHSKSFCEVTIRRK